MARAIFILLLFPFTACGQAIIGMVADSSSMQPIPNVNVVVKNSNRIAVTNSKGAFQIEASPTDTIIFSRVGYYTVKKSAAWVKEVVIIFLTEETKTLKSITINSKNRVPWLPEIPPESPYRNLTNDPQTINTPGFQGLQTFGPGIVVRGPFSRFSKDVKLKKKLDVVREENYKARSYVEIVSDTAVKNKLMRDNNLTEEEYYRVLAQFNEKNKDIIYELQPNELISILTLFFSENKKRK